MHRQTGEARTLVLEGIKQSGKTLFAVSFVLSGAVDVCSRPAY